MGFSYVGDPANLCLSDINLHIRSGETIGSIGGTGSVKSSLVQLIPRLYDATVGTITVGGKDVKTYSLEELRDAVAMVLQKNVLFAGTIKENLRWGNKNASDQELAEVCSCLLYTSVLAWGRIASPTSPFPRVAACTSFPPS